MLSARDLLLGVGLPAVVTGLVLLIALAIRPGREVWVRVVGGLALALGYAAGHAALRREVPSLPPVDSMDWLFWLVLGAGAVWALLEHYPRDIVRAFVALILSSRVVRHVVGPHLEPGLLHSTGIILGLFVLYWLLDVLGRRRPGRAFPLVLWLVASCASVSLALSGSASAGQLAGVLAATLGAFVVLSFIRPGLEIPSGGVAVVAVVLGGVLPLGAIYGLPTPSALLLGLAPLAAFVAEAPPIARMRPFARGLVRVAAVALLAAAATGLAVASYLSTGGAAG